MKADAKSTARLLKTARGQIDGILRMMEEDQYCLAISHQLLACEALLKKVNREVLRAHMESCVRDAFASGQPEEAEAKVEELIGIIAKLSK